MSASSPTTSTATPATSSRTASPARQRLLDAAIAYLAEHGVADLSLRQLAAALGTSHRMLIYHFGSRDGLLVAVVETVELRQRDVLARMNVPPGATFGEISREYWRVLSDPSMWPLERLFFEMVGQALAGRPHAEPLLESLVDSWLAYGGSGLAEFGVPPDEARAQLRLGMAVFRGLLMDLLSTGDRDGVNAAVELYIADVEARIAAAAG